MEIGSIGVRSETGSRGAGKDNLKQAEKFLVNNPQFITQKTVLLFDHDVGKPDKDHSGILFVRSLPFNATNSKFRDGIENLLPLGIFEDRFYTVREVIQGGGRTATVREPNKRAICTFVCKERRNPEDFELFRPILESLRILLLPKPTI